MMHVYRLRTDPQRYCNFAPSDDTEAGLVYDRFDGTPLATEWTSLHIVAADEDDSTAELPDHGLLGVVPVLSWRAVEALLDLITPNGELLPVRHARGEYCALNVTRVIDALDEEHSELTRFPPTGRILSVADFVFRPEVISETPIFKIPQLVKTHIFVSERFVERVRTHRLTGFNLPEVWSA